jgi:hypothetical protein
MASLIKPPPRDVPDLCSILLDDLPGCPRFDSQGNIDLLNPGLSAACLLLPLAVMAGNGLYVIGALSRLL